jgi:hypothetical protein
MKSILLLDCPIVQHERWDLTRCFEERVLLPTPLLILFACSVIRVWTLRNEETKERTFRSKRLLIAKEVNNSGFSNYD